MKKYPIYFLLWLGLNTYLLLSNLNIDHGSINFFYPFFISLKYEVFEIDWTAPSYDFSEYFFYAVLPFLYYSLKKKKSETEDGISTEENKELSSVDSTILKWYDKPVNVILLSIFIFPVGLYCIYKSKELTKKIKVICLIICALATISTIRGVYEEVNNKNETEIPYDLQLKIDEINDRKIKTVIEPCMSIECYDNKILNLKKLINDIDALYYEALATGITLTKNEIIKGIYSEIKNANDKRKILVDEENQELDRIKQEELEEKQKMRYDSLENFVSENERILDNCEYDLDHMSRYDPMPEFGILFTVMMNNIEEKQGQINQFPDLKSRLDYIFQRMRELNRRSY